MKPILQKLKAWIPDPAKRRLVVGSVISVFVVLAVIGVIRFYERGDQAWKQIPTQEAVRGEFVVKITEVGVFKAVKEVIVTAPDCWWVWRRSLNTLVTEETKVKAGDVVAELDTKDLEQRLREDEAQLKQAKADKDKNVERLNLEQINNRLTVETAEADLEMSKARLEQAAREYQRIKELVEARLVPADELEAAQIRHRKAELGVRRAEYHLETVRMSQVTGEKINQTNIDEAGRWYEYAEERVERIKKQIEESKVRAPVDGIVIHSEYMSWHERTREKIKEGDQIRSRQALFSIPDLSEMLVRTQVPETEIDRVHVGQDVYIQADAYSDLKLTGKVTQIIQLAISRDEAIGAGFVEKDAEESKVFEMTVRLDKSDPRLRPGTTAEVEIIVKVLPEAIVVPFEAVFERDKKTYVYIAHDHRWEEREVKVGDRSGEEVAIEEGLEGGEQVIMKNPLLVAS